MHIHFNIIPYAVLFFTKAHSMKVNNKGCSLCSPHQQSTQFFLRGSGKRNDARYFLPFHLVRRVFRCILMTRSRKTDGLEYRGVSLDKWTEKMSTINASRGWIDLHSHRSPSMALSFTIDCSWANETSKLTVYYEFKRGNNLRANYAKCH